MKAQTILPLQEYYFNAQHNLITAGEMACRHCGTVIKNRPRYQLALNKTDTVCPGCQRPLLYRDYVCLNPLSVRYTVDGQSAAVDTYLCFIEQSAYVYVPRENLRYFLHALVHYYLKELFPETALWVNNRLLYAEVRNYLAGFYMRPEDFFIWETLPEGQDRYVPVGDLSPDNFDNIVRFIEEQCSFS